MTISVVIPTFNRLRVWERGLLLDSLSQQTDKDFELLISCDGDDGTVAFLKDNPWNFRFRIFICDHPKDKPTDSLIPDNVLFRECKTDLLIHCDDDGFLSEHTVAFAKKLMLWHGGVFLGQVWSLNPDTLEVIQKDFPNRQLADGQPEIVPIENTHAASALYLAPAQLIRDIGGHDMQHIGYRGVDSRLGYRLGQIGQRLWLVNSPHFRFYHLGLTNFYQLPVETRVTTLHEDYRVPMLGNMNPCVIANGGEKFWGENFPIKYAEI